MAYGWMADGIWFMGFETSAIGHPSTISHQPSAIAGVSRRAMTA
jgi:hypothetical protein